MRLIRFHIKDVRHVPGKLHYTADTLSRKIPESTVQPTVEENKMNAYFLSVIDALPASNPRLKEIQQDEDEVYTEGNETLYGSMARKKSCQPCRKALFVSTTGAHHRRRVIAQRNKIGHSIQLATPNPQPNTRRYQQIQRTRQNIRLVARTQCPN